MEFPAALTAAENPAVSEINPNTANASSNASAAKLADDFDSFMLLLTTQLKNQDPTDPLDTNELTSQLVQFSGVEQAIQTNRNLENLISLTRNEQVNNAVDFIGKTVDASGTTGFLEKGVAEFAYEVPFGAQDVTLAVLDENNRPVYVTQGDSSSGRKRFSWNGVNSFTGSQMPDGAYTLGIQVEAANGELLEASTFTTGTVTAVALEEGEMMLTLNGKKEISLDDVLAVRQPGAADSGLGS